MNGAILQVLAASVLSSLLTAFFLGREAPAGEGSPDPTPPDLSAITARLDALLERELPSELLSPASPTSARVPVQDRSGIEELQEILERLEALAQASRSYDVLPTTASAAPLDRAAPLRVAALGQVLGEGAADEALMRRSIQLLNLHEMIAWLGAPTEVHPGGEMTDIVLFWRHPEGGSLEVWVSAGLAVWASVNGS